MFIFYFFFSSRRRHTRWNCDWSSDVCSSDLDVKAEVIHINTDARPKALQIALLVPLLAGLIGFVNAFRMVRLPDSRQSQEMDEIGRASCRERVEVSVGGVVVKGERNEKWMCA